MELVVVKIEITDEKVTFIRIPKGKENDFCTGIKEIYALSDRVKIIMENKNHAEWRENEYTQKAECTACGKPLDYYYADGVPLTSTQYCPNCGAKMIN